MSRTRQFLYSLPLVALLSACSGGGTPSTLPADPAAVNQPPNTTAEQAIDPAAQPDSISPSEQTQQSAQTESGISAPVTAQSVTAQSVTAQTAGVPAHIATWARDEYYSAGALGTAAQVRTYLTYAEGGGGNNKAMVDCRSGGCQSVFYFDPHFLYDKIACNGGTADLRNLLSHSNETWFVHRTGYSDAVHRIHGSYVMNCGGRMITIPVYALNTLSSSLRTYFRTYFETAVAGWDHFFMDDTSGQVLSQFYGPGGGFCLNEVNHYCTSTQEMRTNAAVVSEHAALASALPISGFYNGIDFTGNEPNDLNILQSSSHFIGAICEGCVVSNGTFRPTMYVKVLNTMAAINHTRGAFLELNHGISPVGSAAQIAQRIITTAMAWLGYSEGHTIISPDLEAATQRLAVFPENSIYPTTPIETMSTGAVNIEVAPGVYRREFRACYYNRAAIGPCAAIVNGTGRDVTVSSAWLHQTYGHVVVPIGGDIPGGGRVSLTGTRFYVNHTYIAPARGMLIVR